MELEKRKLEEEKLRDELENDLDKVLEESAEGLDALDNEDVVRNLDHGNHGDRSMHIERE